MPTFQNVVDLTTNGERSIKIILAKGFDFFEFKDEPEYSVYTSFPKGTTARYHFIEMITQGGHGIDRPMTNAEIIKVHSDLSNEKIDSLRAFYNDNVERRPFKFNLESTRPLTDQNVLEAVNNIENDFVKYFKTTRPIIEPSGITFENSINSGTAVTTDNILNGIRGSNQTDAKFVGNFVPPVANIGQYWLNTGSGRLFVYLSDGSTSGVTSAWVEI